MDAPRSTRQVFDPVAIGLVTVALVASLGLVGPLVRPSEVPVMVAGTIALLGYRIWLLTHPGDVPARRLGFWLGLPIQAVLVYISPIFGLAAFLGYIESPQLAKGIERNLGLAGTAIITAAAQIGGPRSDWASWAVYFGMLGLNLLIVAIITMAERAREQSITKLETMVAELTASEQRNAALREQLLTQAREAGIQDERDRLSREIHDTVAQGLVAIITQLEAATPDAPDLPDRLDRARGAAREALGEARRAVKALASPRLDTASLAHALAELVRQTGETTGLDAHFQLLGDPVSTDADAELLRITQEALSNAVRHAEASRLVVTLDYEPDEVRLDVRDNGRGFDLNGQASGRGLPGMRERLVGLGGTLEIETSEGGGCTISAAVPR